MRPRADIPSASEDLALHEFHNLVGQEISLADRFSDHAADLLAVALEHLDDFEKAVGLASTGEAGDPDFECLSHATHAGAINMHRSIKTLFESASVAERPTLQMRSGSDGPTAPLPAAGNEINRQVPGAAGIG